MFNIGLQMAEQSRDIQKNFEYKTLIIFFVDSKIVATIKIVIKTLLK